MASPRSIEVKVGVLILSALGLLAMFILVMGGVNFQSTYSIFVDFDNPGGLQSGAPVRIAGVKVGKISDISFRGGTDARTGKREPLVRLKVQIEQRYQKSVHENSIFFVTNQSVLGEQFLAIEPGSSDRPVLNEGAIVRGLDPPRLDMLIAEMYELLHSTVSGLRENKAEIGEAFDGLRKTLKGSGEFMERNKDRLDRIAANVEKITVDTDETVKAARGKFVDNPQVDQILANAERVSGDAARDVPPLLADAKQTMANAKRISDAVGDPKQAAKLKQAVDDVAEITGRAKAVTADAEAILAHVKRGKGTVGAVVMDEQLYDDLQEMVRDSEAQPLEVLLAGVAQRATPRGVTTAFESGASTRAPGHTTTLCSAPRPVTLAPAPMMLPVTSIPSPTRASGATYDARPLRASQRVLAAR
ncbi:MAG: MlaD family protein [Minicystis sp.]